MSHAFALKVQRKVNKGWKKESSKLGQLYDVIRNGTVVVANKQFFVEHWRRFLEIEVERSSFFYIVKGDRTLLQIGDQLNSKDADSSLERGLSGERYTIIGERLQRYTLAIRTDTACKIYRTTTSAPAGNTPPTYIAPDVCNMSQAVRDANGVWAFLTAAQQLVGGPYDGTIYCGFNLNPHPVSVQSLGLPLSTHPSGWGIGLGLLNGIQLAEGDILVDEDNNYFKFDIIYRQDNTNLVYQIQATKLVF